MNNQSIRTPSVTWRDYETEGDITTEGRMESPYTPKCTKHSPTCTTFKFPTIGIELVCLKIEIDKKIPNSYLKGPPLRSYIFLLSISVSPITNEERMFVTGRERFLHGDEGRETELMEYED